MATQRRFDRNPICYRLVLGLPAVALTGLLSVGCGGPSMARSSNWAARTAVVSQSVDVNPATPLVMLTPATLDVLGPQGMLCVEAQVLNSRKDTILGADLPPTVSPINTSQTYIRDQQWILNGRPWQNYMQTTRSIQLRSR